MTVTARLSEPGRWRRIWVSGATLALACILARDSAHAPHGWLPFATLLLLTLGDTVTSKQILHGITALICGALLVRLLATVMRGDVLLIGVTLSLLMGFTRLRHWLYWRWHTRARWLNFICFWCLLLPVPVLRQIPLPVFMHDVISGALLGALGQYLASYRREPLVLQHYLVTVLQASQAYLQAIGELLLQEPQAPAACQRAQQQLTHVLVTQFPDWVYQLGYNPLLQQGQRHFLVRLSHVSEILFTLHYLARQPVAMTLLESWRTPLRQAIDAGQAIMAALCVKLNTETLPPPVSNLDEEIAALAATYQQEFNIPLALLDTVSDALTLSGVIFAVKDMQRELSKLAEALR